LRNIRHPTEVMPMLAQPVETTLAACSRGHLGLSDTAAPRATNPTGLLTPGFDVHWATGDDDIREAQQLRYRVFAAEMGARLIVPTGTGPGLDVDRFDQYCDHLLVRARVGKQPLGGPVVGTYRVLGPAAAVRAGGLYAESEFDLAPLRSLRANAVELGRSCVDPAWRSGGVIMALWGALGQYMLRHRLDTMIGCASIPLTDGGAVAHRLWQRLRLTHMAAAQWQVQPYTNLHAEPFDLDTQPAPTARCDPVPPLIKGYLRCGARVLGPPALDTVFNTADLPIMLRVEELTPRYRKHFFGC
jgi:putative hemolysin